MVVVQKVCKQEYLNIQCFFGGDLKCDLCVNMTFAFFLVWDVFGEDLGAAIFFPLLSLQESTAICICSINNVCLLIHPNQVQKAIKYQFSLLTEFQHAW